MRKIIPALLEVACSRLSDSGEDAKVKGTLKVVGARKRRKEKVRAFSIQLSRSLEQAILEVIDECRYFYVVCYAGYPVERSNVSPVSGYARFCERFR